LTHCVPDGVIDLDDILAVSNAFSGDDYFTSTGCSAPCQQGASGGSSGSEPETLASSGQTSGIVSLERNRQAASGQRGLVVVDVFLSGAVDLRGYQIALDAIGGGDTPSGGGQLVLEDVRIDTNRADYVFHGLDSYPATDAVRGRLASALATGDKPSGDAAYLGTFTFRMSPDAIGTFSVEPRTSETMLRDAAGTAIGVQTDGGMTVAAN
jgi:hypothetical protein